MADEPPKTRPDGFPVGKPFVKGASGNPKGRPRIRTLRRQLKRLEPKALEVLAACLTLEDGKPSKLALDAAALLYAYRYGKPGDQDSVTVHGSGGDLVIEIRKLTAEPPPEPTAE